MVCLLRLALYKYRYDETLYLVCSIRWVWRYQRGNHDQNPLIEKGQTTQWQRKDKRTNNDLQSIHIKLKIEKHEKKTKNRGWTQVLRKWSSCYTSRTRCVNLVTVPVICLVDYTVMYQEVSLQKVERDFSVTLYYNDSRWRFYLLQK